jgi:GAF domain-containing protein
VDVLPLATYLSGALDVDGELGEVFKVTDLPDLGSGWLRRGLLYLCSKRRARSMVWNDTRLDSALAHLARGGLRFGTMALDGERVELLYAVTRGLATFHEVDGLVRFATRRLREVFGADGCAILLLDEKRREFRFPVASQRAGATTSATALGEVRFPADQGIAGAVLAGGEPILVNDVQNDRRFYPGVDQKTGVTTRTLLAAPLRSARGAVGVIEVVNPSVSPLCTDDLEFLNALASDVAVAYEKARLYARLGEEIAIMRWLTRVAGAGLVVVGALLAGAAVFATLVRALPLERVLSRPALYGGVVVVGLGIVLLRATRMAAKPGHATAS